MSAPGTCEARKRGMQTQSSQKCRGDLEGRLGSLGSKPKAAPISQRHQRLCQEKVSSSAISFLKMG